MRVIAFNENLTVDGSDPKKSPGENFQQNWREAVPKTKCQWPIESVSPSQSTSLHGHQDITVGEIKAPRSIQLRLSWEPSAQNHSR